MGSWTESWQREQGCLLMPGLMPGLHVFLRSPDDEWWKALLPPVLPPLPGPLIAGQTDAALRITKR